MKPAFIPTKYEEPIYPAHFKKTRSYVILPWNVKVVWEACVPIMKCEWTQFDGNWITIVGRVVFTMQ